MRVLKIGIALFASTAFLARPASAQQSSPSESLELRSTTAYTWTDGGSNIAQLDGPVAITIDDTTLKASSAVVWLRRSPEAMFDEQDVEIALVGNAEVRRGNAVRSGQVLFVTARVRGVVRIIADQRLARDQSKTDIFRRALETRESTSRPLPPPPATPARRADGLAGSSRVEPPSDRKPVFFQAGQIDLLRGPDGKVAGVIRGGVRLYQPQANGDFLEFLAERVVVYTYSDNTTEVFRSFNEGNMPIRGVYLEGDVRVTYTPAGANSIGEQRFAAERVYYDLETHRAVLTDVILHSADPTTQLPIVIRANTIHQLAKGEYRTRGVEISTSSFATPSYSLRAGKAYIRQVDAGDPEAGTRTNFYATNTTLNMFGVPLFWLPVAGGSVTERGIPLRDLSIVNSSRFGTGVRTEWGLFETAGRTPPPGLDMSFRLDYLGDRGPGFGLNAEYDGGFITETTRDPWNFQGEFTAYGVFDDGIDDLGASRPDIDPQEDFRGRILWEHQHFFPDDWQVQVRGGYVTDPTFLEQWFEREFYRNQPHDLSLYVKRQRDTEALTFAANFRPSDFITNIDYVQEQAEVERFPEIGYHRIGDSFAEDSLTFVSSNRVAAIRFARSDATLAEQGYFSPGLLSPGIPSVGQTGYEEDINGRGDFRQEVSFPFSVGEFRVLPYVVGRYTAYADSPFGDSEHRVHAGAGVRINTAFWAIDDTARSVLFDINRIRHVIEPELHVYSSASSVDQNELFIYDEEIDRIHDVSAISLALRQRWQTKRGGPGRWRNTDFFTLNVVATFFNNEPEDEDLPPNSFRGLFFPTHPETSVPREHINADALWRISDTTAIIGDIQYNFEETELATAAIGFVARRDQRLEYFLGLRYIEEIDSNIGTISMNYMLSRRYTINVSQSYDFGDSTNRVTSSGTITRRFDRFLASLRLSYDARNDESSVSFNLLPQGLRQGLSSDSLLEPGR